MGNPKRAVGRRKHPACILFCRIHDMWTVSGGDDGGGPSAFPLAARAYADWLARITGARWDLPTEIEWEKAARGTDGRIYPWGDAWDPLRANTHARGARRTSPVGAYLDDVSPYGIYDLAGNVSEWTGTNYTLEWDDPYAGGHGDCDPKLVRHASSTWIITYAKQPEEDHR